VFLRDLPCYGSGQDCDFPEGYVKHYMGSDEAKRKDFFMPPIGQRAASYEVLFDWRIV
jgi:hypothetical protein